MTVREALNVFTDVQELRIGYGEGCTFFNPKDTIMVEAFGDYIVDRIYAVNRGSFEIDLAVRPIKATHDGTEG